MLRFFVKQSAAYVKGAAYIVDPNVLCDVHVGVIRKKRHNVAVCRVVNGMKRFSVGGSGVSHEDYRKVISLGVRKINYYTYMAKAGAEAVSNKTYGQFHDLSREATEAMKNDVKAAMEVFAG